MGEASLLPLEIFNALQMFYSEPKKHFAKSNLQHFSFLLALALPWLKQDKKLVLNWSTKGIIFIFFNLLLMPPHEVPFPQEASMQVEGRNVFLVRRC